MAIIAKFKWHNKYGPRKDYDGSVMSQLTPELVYQPSHTQIEKLVYVYTIHYGNYYRDQRMWDFVMIPQKLKQHHNIVLDEFQWNLSGIWDK